MTTLRTGSTMVHDVIDDLEIAEATLDSYRCTAGQSIRFGQREQWVEITIRASIPLRPGRKKKQTATLAELNEGRQ